MPKGFHNKTSNHQGVELGKRRRARKISIKDAAAQSGVHPRTIKALEKGKAVQVTAVGRYTAFLNRARKAKVQKVKSTKIVKRKPIKPVKKSPIKVKVVGNEQITVNGNTITVGNRIQIEIG